MGRNKEILIRVSEKELLLMKENAKLDPLFKTRNREINLSHYIREKALHPKDITGEILITRELKNIGYEIKKIGINVNQVARKINAGFGTALDIEKLEDELKTLDDTFEELKGGLLHGDYENHEHRGDIN